MRETPDLAEQAENTDADMFIMVVHGFAPEFYDGIAFRVDKSCKPRPKKDVVCPHCGRLFETVDAQTKIVVFRCSKNSAPECHKFRHCKICHGIVGIRYA
jgi:hypothetical protein